MSKLSRREFFQKTGYGLGGLALSGMLPGGGFLNSAMASDLADPLSAKQPHSPAKLNP